MKFSAKCLDVLTCFRDNFQDSYSGNPVITEDPPLLINAKRGDYVTMTCNAEGKSVTSVYLASYTRYTLPLNHDLSSRK